jgi:hypothetical protein
LKAEDTPLRPTREALLHCRTLESIRAKCAIVALAAVAVGCVDTSDVAGPYPGVGSRFGGFFIASSDDYPAAMVVGQHYAGTTAGIFGLKSLPYELGLDMAYAKSSDGSESWMIFQPFVDLLLSKWLHTESGTDGYGLIGYRMLMLDRTGPSSTNEVGSAIDLGGGVTSLVGRWDARLVYSVVLGSGTIDGLLMLTGGYRY